LRDVFENFSIQELKSSKLQICSNWNIYVLNS